MLLLSVSVDDTVDLDFPVHSDYVRRFNDYLIVFMRLASQFLLGGIARHFNSSQVLPTSKRVSICLTTFLRNRHSSLSSSVRRILRLWARRRILMRKSASTCPCLRITLMMWSSLMFMTTVATWNGLFSYKSDLSRWGKAWLKILPVSSWVRGTCSCCI